MLFFLFFFFYKKLDCNLHVWKLNQVQGVASSVLACMSRSHLSHPFFLTEALRSLRCSKVASKKEPSETYQRSFFVFYQQELEINQFLDLSDLLSFPREGQIIKKKEVKYLAPKALLALRNTLVWTREFILMGS